MKILRIPAAALLLTLAACGGGGSSSGSPAAQSSSTSSAQGNSSGQTVTTPTVTNTLTAGPGITWTQGAVNLNVNVAGAQQPVTPFANGQNSFAWTGSALYAMAAFTQSYDTTTRNTLAGTLAFITSTDGKTWQAGASPLPAAAGAGFIMYPESMASDGKGNIAVYGQAVPVGTNFGNGASEPLLDETVGQTPPQWPPFVAIANANDMAWTVTMLPVMSPGGLGQISYAYGNWWVAYRPSATAIDSIAVVSSADTISWNSSSATSATFLTAFTQGHPYWSSTGTTLSYSDDLQTWTSYQPTSPDGSVRYMGTAYASSKALVLSGEAIATSSNQEISNGNIVASPNGTQWADGGFPTFQPQNSGFVCNNRFFLWGFSGDGLFFSDDSLNWTNVTVPRPESLNGNGVLQWYGLGGCQPAAGRAFMFTGDDQVIYSD